MVTGKLYKERAEKDDSVIREPSFGIDSFVREFRSGVLASGVLTSGQRKLKK
jgi:hypothetical protein